MSFNSVSLHNHQPELLASDSNDYHHIYIIRLLPHCNWVRWVSLGLVSPVAAVSWGCWPGRPGLLPRHVASLPPSIR